MPELANIPFNATREPGIADGQIGRLKNRVTVEQLALKRFINQRDQPSADFGQKRGFQEFVFQNKRLE